MESQLAWKSQVQRSSLCAKKNTCKLAWEMHRVGQRTKLDRKPKSKGKDTRRACRDTRMWKAIPHTSQRLQAPAISLHSSSSSNLGHNLHFTFLLTPGIGQWKCQGRQIREKQTEQQQQRNRQACKMCNKGQIEVFASALNQCVCN